MNRRELLLHFKNFCLLYGIQGILSPHSFAQATTSKKRFVAFVIKYTGGGTSGTGIGNWTFDQSDSILSPLKPYRNEMAFQLGLHTEFKVPMNSHAAPQVSALTGAMTGANLVNGTYYPTSTLEQFSTGGGSSIDILIGEKLQSIYGSQLPHLSISNYATDSTAASTSGFSCSSWTKGKLNPYFSQVGSLATELKARIQCSGNTQNTALKAAYQKKLNALEIVRKNQLVFESKFIVNKEVFESLQDKLQKSVSKFESSLNGGDVVQQRPSLCDNFPTGNPAIGYVPGKEFDSGMNTMYDLAIAALQSNVTRSITFNLWNMYCHHTSHFGTAATQLPEYIINSRYLQESVAKFLEKLKAAGMYNDTLIFCNAGSSMKNEVHNYENLSTYVINGDKTGIVGSVNDPKPIGSLLLDILHKFGITYSEFGGTNHVLGVGKRENFI